MHLLRQYIQKILSEDAKYGSRVNLQQPGPDCQLNSKKNLDNIDDIDDHLLPFEVDNVGDINDAMFGPVPPNDENLPRISQDPFVKDAMRHGVNIR